MSKSETGEFELVLGNKQLLSVFFIVVILLCVFFTMGYIVGRNSSPPPLEANNKKTTEQVPNPNPIIVDSPTAPPPSQIPTATETKPSSSTESKPGPVVAATPTPEPVAKEKKPEPVKETASKEKEKKPVVEAAPVAASSSSVQKGSHYLQVQALPADQAALVVEVMRKKGFAATTEVVPNKPGLTRILVGPVSPGAAATEMKQKLDAAGFKGKQSILRKL